MIKMNSKSRRRIIVAAVLILIMLTFVIPWPIRMKKMAYEFVPGSDKAIEREITIEGWYRNRLFMKDYYRGQIKISGYEITDLSLKGTVIHSLVNSGKWIKISTKDEEPLRYSLPEAGAYIPFSFDELDRSYDFGLLLSDWLMRHFVIELFVHEDVNKAYYSEDDGTVIVAGFDSREDAESWFRKLKGWK